MVSDQEIATGVESLLRSSNPNSVTSIDGFVKQLEAKLGFDLSHKEHFIRDQIDFLLRSQVIRPVVVPSSSSTKDHHFALQHQHQHPPPHPQFLNPPTNNTTTTTPHPEIPPYFGIPLNNYQSPPPLNPQPQQQPQQQKPQRKKPKKAPEVLIPNVAVDPDNPETPKESTPTGTKRRGGTGGLNKVCGVSPELQAIVGEPTMPRTQIVKQLWAYIRQNNLQDPSNKRKIICNDALRLVFETDSTDMFKMNKLLSKHIISLEPSKEPRQPSKKLKTEVESTSETTEAAPPSLVIISDTLARFFGSGGREMSQSEAVRRVWEYIKVNHLEVMVGNESLLFLLHPLKAGYVPQKRGEDPRNSMVIVCDPKLQELFGCESISALRLSDMLVPHFFMPS